MFDDPTFDSLPKTIDLWQKNGSGIKGTRRERKSTVWKKPKRDLFCHLHLGKLQNTENKTLVARDRILNIGKRVWTQENFFENDVT